MSRCSSCQRDVLSSQIALKIAARFLYRLLLVIPASFSRKSKDERFERNTRTGKCMSLSHSFPRCVVRRFKESGP